jgi:hypothetical protein
MVEAPNAPYLRRVASSAKGASFAAIELPDQAGVDRHGIALDRATARVVLIAVSRLLALSDAGERDQAYQMMKLVAPSAAVAVAGSDGAAPPLALNPDDGRVPRGQTAHAKLGIHGSDISRVWARSVEEPSRCLPLDWVLGFLPAAAWPHVAALIELGLEQASRRLNEGINVRSLQVKEQLMIDETIAFLSERVFAPEAIELLRAEIATGEADHAAGRVEAKLARLRAEIADVDQAIERQVGVFEKYDNPNHPVVLVAEKRIISLAERKADLEGRLRVAEEAAAKQPEADPIELLASMPDLRPALESYNDEDLADLFAAFDVEAGTTTTRRR